MRPWSLSAWACCSPAGPPPGSGCGGHGRHPPGGLGRPGPALGRPGHRRPRPRCCRRPSGPDDGGPRRRLAAARRLRSGGRAQRRCGPRRPGGSTGASCSGLGSPRPSRRSCSSVRNKTGTERGDRHEHRSARARRERAMPRMDVCQGCNRRRVSDRSRPRRGSSSSRRSRPGPCWSRPARPSSWRPTSTAGCAVSSPPRSRTGVGSPA